MPELSVLASLPKLSFTHKLNTDVLVIGGGVAGLFAAISASDFASRVMVVDKGKIGRSGCGPFAAGTYSVCSPGDNLDVWLRELIEQGDYLNDQEWIKVFCENGYKMAQLLDEWGSAIGRAVFEKDNNGNFLRKRSRGHIHTYHFVMNNLAMMDVLRGQASRRGVEFFERIMVTDLLLGPSGRWAGAQGFNYRTGETFLFQARAGVVAAGGCGFKAMTLGHRNLTGDLQAAAFRTGVTLKSMEQASFNTSQKEYDTTGLNLMVNVGGRFINDRGEDFMWRYGSQLGPRARLQDLAFAFCQEVREGRGPVRLDMTAAPVEDQRLMRKVLPQLFAMWERADIDPFQRPLEWVPVFRGTIGSSGGINTDRRGQTNISGLFAAGDACFNWIGAALPFAALSGYIAGESAGNHSLGSESIEKVDPRTDFISPLLPGSGIKAEELSTRIQRLLFSIPVGFLKTGQSLDEALTRLEEIRSQAGQLYAPDLHHLLRCLEARNMVTLAKLFLLASRFRQESRGYHFREDFPQTDNVNWLKWVLIRRDGAGVKIWTEDIPLPYLRPR